MFRLLIFIIFLLVAAVGLAKLADMPGTVSLVWQGWQVETSLLFVLMLTGLAMIILFLAFQALDLVFNFPRRFKRRKNIEHHERGLSVLTEALAALAVSDINSAKKLTKQADKLLDHPPITQLLTSQLARLEGKDHDAASHLKPLLEHKETRFLAARNLLEHARNSGDTEQALAYAEQAESIRPDSSYASLALFDLYTHAKRWQQALDVIRTAKKHKAFTKDEAARYTAIIQYQHALHLYGREDYDTALSFVKQAYKTLPNMIPAALLLASTYGKLGQKRHVPGVLHKTWKTFAHPSLAKLYKKLFAEESPEKRLKRVEKLASFNPNDIESQIAVAEAALDASDYTKARNNLKIALSRQETPRICKLMARLEEAENKDKEKADVWMERALKANMGPSWMCDSCNAILEQWTLHCPECNSFDAIGWKVNKLNFVSSEDENLPETVSA